MVGYEYLDHDAIGESHIGISVAEATDYTKSESDLVLAQPALLPISSAVRISRETCQIMKRYTVSHWNAFKGLVAVMIFGCMTDHLHLNHDKWLITCNSLQIYTVSSTVHLVSTIMTIYCVSSFYRRLYCATLTLIINFIQGRCPYHFTLVEL